MAVQGTQKVDKVLEVQTPAGPVAPAATPEVRPQGVVGLGTERHQVAVAGRGNVGPQLAAPATAQTEEVAQLTGFESLPFAARIEMMSDIVERTGNGGLESYQGQRQFLNLLWSTPAVERPALASFIQNTFVHVTSMWVPDNYMARLAHQYLNGSEWSEYSYFMTTYGPGMPTHDPMVTWDPYRSRWIIPDFWMSVARPYDYVPYWQYSLPLYIPDAFSYHYHHYYSDPYRYEPPVYTHQYNQRPGWSYGGNQRPGGYVPPAGGNQRPGGYVPPAGGNQRPGGYVPPAGSNQRPGGSTYTPPTSNSRPGGNTYTPPTSNSRPGGSVYTPPTSNTRPGGGLYTAPSAPTSNLRPGGGYSAPAPTYHAPSAPMSNSRPGGGFSAPSAPAYRPSAPAPSSGGNRRPGSH